MATDLIETACIADRERKVDAGQGSKLEFIFQHGAGQRLISMRLFVLLSFQFAC
jgi:hypothetical protein